MQISILDLLYLVLSFAILMGTIYFIVFVIEATKVMKDVRKITDSAETIVSSFRDIPVMIANKIKEKMKGKKKEEE